MHRVQRRMKVRLIAGIVYLLRDPDRERLSFQRQRHIFGRGIEEAEPHIAADGQLVVRIEPPVKLVETFDKVRRQAEIATGIHRVLPVAVLVGEGQPVVYLGVGFLV